MKTSLIGDRGFYKGVIRIALPIALQNLLGTTASMVDTVMIGTQGERYVAAVGLCSQYSSLFFSGYFGFVSGGILFFSQYWGARNEKGITKAYGLTLSCMFLVSLLFAGLAIFAPDFVLGIYTDKPVIREAGVAYLRILGFSFPFQVIAMAISGLLRSTEKVRIPLYASIAAVFTNIFFNWVLIYGHLGFPAMGAPGAAVGTLISAIVNVIVLYVYCARDKGSFVTRFREQFGWKLSFIKEYFSKCLPIIINELLYGTGQMLINVVMGRQDEAAVAATAVFRVIEGIIYAFFGGMASASSVMVGVKVGAGDHFDAYRDAKRFTLLCPMVTMTICLLIQPFKEPLLRGFGLGDVALGYGMTMLLIYIFAATVRTCNYIINNVLRAGGEALVGTVFEIGCLFLVAVPGVFLAGIVWQWPFIAVFSMMYLDEFLRLAIGIWYLNSGRWVKPVTSEGIKALAAFREALHIKPRKEKNAS